MNREKEYEEYIDGLALVQEALEEADEVIEYGEALLDAHWDFHKTNVREAFASEGNNFDSEHFHNVIWELSTNILDEKEVSVIVDRDNQLFISKGTRSFVDYESESVKGMKIPLRCWIHTHPFGQAYFSGTDWMTINNQKPILESAIVLGDRQKMKWWKQYGKEQLCRIHMIQLDDSEE
tara:strand:+ start:1908 stop:2444 length:537 start_codon:yes stop_codon:yes gene_type:complete